MQLYLHVDRTKRLKTGDTIDKLPTGGASFVRSMLPFIDVEYMEHLKKLMQEGLSLQGNRYIGNGIDGKAPPLSGFLIEFYYEYVRFKNFQFMPSRFQSAYAFGDMQTAKGFRDNHKEGGKIYEILFNGRVFKADMSLLRYDVDRIALEQYANDYWQGKPMLKDKNYKPVWEFLIDLPAVIGEEVKC